MRTNAIVVFFCLVCAVFSGPINVSIDLDSPEQGTNVTEVLLVAQSSGNDTSEIQSSSESESSESVESESSDNTSEESDSVESNETEFLAETRDDSMGSEENVRKSWVGVFATVVQDNSVEDNSTEVKGQPEILSKAVEKQTMEPPTAKAFKHSSNAKLALVHKATGGGESSSESAESSHTLLMTATVDSSQSVSSESNETSSESEASDSASESAQSSESSEEDSSDSDSAELSPVTRCVNGTQSCESEEYFFQDIGDDANYSVDNLMVPDEDERELSLR